MSQPKDLRVLVFIANTTKFFENLLVMTLNQILNGVDCIKNLLYDLISPRDRELFEFFGYTARSIKTKL